MPRSTWTTLVQCLVATIRTASTLAAAQTANTSSEPLVCTPTECLAGHNALAAGIVVSTPLNFTLLPGTYTPATFSASTRNLSSTNPFSKGQSPSTSPSVGFTSSGSLSSPSYTVSFLPGLTTYSDPYYEGTPTYSDSSCPSSSSANSSGSNSSPPPPPPSPRPLSSLFLEPNSYAILSFGPSSPRHDRVVVWDSIPDVRNLGIATTTATLLDWYSNDGSCPAGCGRTGTNDARNGSSSSSSKCQCETGWTGPSCGECLPNHFGPSCQACREGCKECDDGLTGTGLCLDWAILANSPSLCNCVNGICQGNSTSSNCDCNAGWTRASNGTQCAACGPGYYLTLSGDCQACDPSCASCHSPTGACQTCQAGLQPVSSDPTRCTTATTAVSNGTFVSCPARTFFSTTTNDCVACDAMCETCYKPGSDGCLECRTPNVLLEGACVALDQKTGVCDGGSSKLTKGTNAGWVYDNQKKVCDALPSKCLKGGIDAFSTSSSRNDLTCSACIPGTFLVDRRCVDTCPEGTTVSADGLTCQPCDSSCSTCAPALPAYCTSCSNPSHLVLNGTCISSPSCPTGFFLSPSSSSSLASSSASTSVSPASASTLTPTTSVRTCLACHPNCQTCSPDDPTQCLSCDVDSVRPVLDASSHECVATCARGEYFERSSRGGGECVKCSSECGSCWGPGKNECLSCTGDRRQVRGGACVATDDCVVVDRFGVCLKELVTVAARSPPAPPADDGEGRRKVPWWLILAIILAFLTLVGTGVWWFRKKEQKRRREHTAKFAQGLGDKEVDRKLAALPHSVAYPPLPRSYSTSPPPPLDFSRAARTPSARQPSPVTHDVPLTPRFVLEDPASPISPSPSSSFGSASHRARHRHEPSFTAANTTAPSPGRRPDPTQQRSSASSYGSNSTWILPPPRLGPDVVETGPAPHSFYSERSRTFTTAAGNTLVVNSKNPFFRN